MLRPSMYGMKFRAEDQTLRDRGGHFALRSDIHQLNKHMLPASLHHT